MMLYVDKKFKLTLYSYILVNKKNILRHFIISGNLKISLFKYAMDVHC